MSPVFEIFLILALILINGTLAMAEIAVVSARRARLQRQADSGDEKARLALTLSQSPGEFLSAVQIGITLVGILVGAFGGITLAEHLAVGIGKVPYLAPYRNSLSVGLVVVLITYLTLIIGELVPKRLALNNPERIARAVAGPMRMLARLATPLVRILNASTNLVLKIIGVRPTTEPPVTEEEIKVLIDQGTRAGVFAEAEQDMLEAILRLGDRRIETLMTPRKDIVWLDLDEPLEENKRRILGSLHARFPVAHGNLDNLVGFVEAKDLLMRSLSGQPLDFQTNIRPALFVPESMSALKVLGLFRETGAHLAMVLDEYGGLQGLVTVSDIFKSIIGDLNPSGGPASPGIVQREDGSWLVDGKLLVDEFKEVFHLNELPNEERGNFQTVGGLMMTCLGRIPAVTDHFEWKGLRFEVVDMDGFRVDKVMVSRISEVDQEKEQNRPADM